MVAAQPQPATQGVPMSQILPTIRHDWSQAEVEALFALPFTDLIYRGAARAPCLPRSRTRCR